MDKLNSWKNLDCGLNDDLIKNIENKLNFKTPFPIQKKVIPLFLKNYDVAIESYTGSGKTLAFLIPLINRLIETEDLEKNIIKAIIISPTRELSLQTFNICSLLIEGLSKKITIGELSGGIKNINLDYNKNILICCPGKLKDIMNTDKTKFNQVDYLILDEADRLLECNFEENIRFILLNLPKQRRTGLFSATLNSKKIEDLKKAGLRNPVLVRLKNEMKDKEAIYNIPNELENYYKPFLNRYEKLLFLFQFLKNNKQKGKIIVFFNTCYSVIYYKNLLEKFLNKEIFSINGKMKQKQRIKIYNKIKDLEDGIILSTDVIARGIDFKNVNWIIQVDPPQDPEFFIHRIGRTARSGNFGKALILLGNNELSFIDYLKELKLNLLEYKENIGLVDNFEKMIKIIIKDKDFIIKGNLAFVSFIRSYKEYNLKNIFKFDDLDFSKVLKSFYLIKMPFLKELKDKKIISDEYDKYIEKFKDIKFQDKNKEKQFNEKLEKKKEFINKKKEKFNNKKIKTVVNIKKNRSKSERNRAKNRLDNKNLDEIDYEEKLYKKYKQGKISKKEFENIVDKIEKRYDYN